MTENSPKHTADDVVEKASDAAHDLADKAGAKGDVHKTVDKASDAAKDVTDKAQKTANDVVSSARDFADEGGSRIRSAYEDNPTRFVSIAAIAGAAVIGLIVALAKRR